jgi:WD40 repeat protein
MRIFGPDGSSELLPGSEGHRFNNSLYSADGGIFLTSFLDREADSTLLALWSPSERRKLAEVLYERSKRGRYGRRWADDSIMLLVTLGDGRFGVDTLNLDGSLGQIGARNLIPGYDEETSYVDMNWAAGRLVAATNGHEIFVSEIGENGLSEPKLLGRQPSVVFRLEVDPLGRFVASADSEGLIRLWGLTGSSVPEIVQGPPAIWGMDILGNGRFLSVNSVPETGDMEQWIWSLEGERPELLRRINLGEAATMVFGLLDPVRGQIVQLGVEREIRLWNLSAPADAEPLNLLPGEVEATFLPAFHPQGRWLVAPNNTGLTLWPLNRGYPSVIRKHQHSVNALEFGPRGEWLASASSDSSVRVFPLEGEAPRPGGVLYEAGGPTLGFASGLAKSPAGDRLLVAAGRAGVHLLSLDGKLHQTLPESPGLEFNVAFSSDGRLAAVTSGPGQAVETPRKIVVWHVESGDQIAVLAEGEARADANPQFVGNDHIMALDESGLQKWDINTGAKEMLYTGDFDRWTNAADGHLALLLEPSTSDNPNRAVLLDLVTGAATPLETHGDTIASAAFDAQGEILVTGDVDGTIRVGPATGETPHVLLGHRHSVFALAIDPLGRWVATGSQDATIRLWPMPDLSKPPLHTLPRNELIAKLKTLTNVRVVRDEESVTGWKLTHDPFPGWETVPTW